MSSINNNLPKIQTILNNENRLFDCSFYDSIDDAFEALQAFIIDSYSLSSNEQFSIQYEDDDNDFVTISSVEDFKEAIEEANSNDKALKIFVTLQQTNPTFQSLNVDDLQKQENTGFNVKEEKTNKNDENDNYSEQKFVNEILNDVRNNKIFREELVSFVKTALLLYQENHSDPDYDITTCILTALSSYETLMEHETLQCYIMNLLPLITPKIQHFSSFLLNLDVNTVDIWLNQIIESWTNGAQSPIFSPFYHMITNILQTSSMNRPTFSENNQQNEWSCKRQATDQQPVISSSLKDEFSFGKQQDNTNYHNYNSHPMASLFNIGSLLSTFLNPHSGNAANINHNQQYQPYSLFGGPQLSRNNDCNSNSNFATFNNDNKTFESSNNELNVNSGSETIKIEKADNATMSYNNETKENDDQVENSVRNIDPYAKQIQLLLEMGFTNVDMLRNLLASHGGLVNVVVDLLS